MLVAALAAAYAGRQLRLRSDRDRQNTGPGLASDGQEGGIPESHAPMEMLRDSLKANPPKVFDRWRTAGKEAY